MLYTNVQCSVCIVCICSVRVYVYMCAGSSADQISTRNRISILYDRSPNLKCAETSSKDYTIA